MDVFASVAVLGSLFVSVGSLAMGAVAIYTDAATMLITFLLIGRLIEIHARQERGLAVQALRSLAPATVTKLTSSGGTKAERTDLLAELAPGDTVLIRDRQSGVSGRVGEVRLNRGGCRLMKKK